MYAPLRRREGPEGTNAYGQRSLAPGWRPRTSILFRPSIAAETGCRAGSCAGNVTR